MADDEFLIAATLEDTLRDAGADTVCVSTLASALKAAGSETLSAAVLDVRLGRHSIGSGRGRADREGRSVRVLHRPAFAGADPRQVSGRESAAEAGEAVHDRRGDDGDVGRLVWSTHTLAKSAGKGEAGSCIPPWNAVRRLIQRGLRLIFLGLCRG